MTPSCPICHACLSLIPQSGPGLGFFFCFVLALNHLSTSSTQLPPTPPREGLLWGWRVSNVGRGRGLQRYWGERVQRTLLRAAAMSNGTGLWEPAYGEVGGDLWLAMSVSACHCSFSHQRSQPPCHTHSQHLTPANPPPGHRWHIPSLSIDESEKCTVCSKCPKTEPLTDSEATDQWLKELCITTRNQQDSFCLFSLKVEKYIYQNAEEQDNLF